MRPWLSLVAWACISNTIGVEQVQDVTAWLGDNGFKGFLGEFGGSARAACLGAVDNLMTYLGENSDVWLGWTIWASAEWSIQHNVPPGEWRRHAADARADASPGRALRSAELPSCGSAEPGHEAKMR